MEEFEHELEEMLEKSRRSHAQSFDGSSVKEVDPAAHFRQVQSKDEHTASEGSATSQNHPQYGSAKELLTLEDGFQIEELLKAGTEELLKTSILSLRHLSDQKIISLMQLIVESGHGQWQRSSQNKLPSSIGLGIFNKFIARMKKFVSSGLIITTRSQLGLYRMITMGRSKSLTCAVPMSDVVAGVLAGNYLTDLQHLALPSCDVSAIVKALIDGHIFSLQYLDLQGPVNDMQYTKSKHLKRLFRTGFLRKLHHLRLSRCMDAEDMEELAAAIEMGRITALKHLDLSSNLSRGQCGSKCLSRLMSCSALLDLQHLNLSNCGIGDVGIQALASAMEVRGPWNLKYLNLGSNEVGDEGFSALLRIMKADRVPYLRELHLLYNYGIGDECKVMGARVLEKGHAPALQVLYMSSHSISDRVAAAVVAAYKNNSELIVELPGILWPNEFIEREAAEYRERNLSLLASSRKDLDLQLFVPEI